MPAVSKVAGSLLHSSSEEFPIPHADHIIYPYISHGPESNLDQKQLESQLGAQGQYEEKKRESPSL